MRNGNQGSVLVTCLLLLLILNLLTVSALQNSTLEERLSGQVRRHEHAFAAAETALAQAEHHVLHQINKTITCTLQDDLGTWHGPANQLECLKQSSAPCTQGWCGPHAHDATESECQTFNPAEIACWAEAPNVTFPNDEFEISARTIVRLRDCRNDLEREICLFDVFARAFVPTIEKAATSVLVQSQFEVIAYYHPEQISSDDNINEDGETECI